MERKLWVAAQRISCQGAESAAVKSATNTSTMPRCLTTPGTGSWKSQNWWVSAAAAQTSSVSQAHGGLNLLCLDDRAGIEGVITAVNDQLQNCTATPFHV